MNTRIILLLVGVASLMAGCFLAAESGQFTSGKLSATRTDRAGVSNSAAGDGINRSGSVRSSGGQREANDSGNWSGVGDKRDNGNSNMASLDDLSEGDRVSVRSSVNPGIGYDFVYVGRNEQIEHRQLAQVIGWSVASSGIAFIAGMMVYRNNKKKLERVIVKAVEAGETAQEVVNKYIKK